MKQIHDVPTTLSATCRSILINLGLPKYFIKNRKTLVNERPDLPANAVFNPSRLQIVTIHLNIY